MNRPGDYVHSIHWGYGWLIMPWFGGWLAWSYTRRFRFATDDTFHNCRATGVW